MCDLKIREIATFLLYSFSPDGRNATVSFVKKGKFSNLL